MGRPGGRARQAVRPKKGRVRNGAVRIYRYGKNRYKCALLRTGAGRARPRRSGLVTRRSRPDCGPVTCDVITSQGIAANSPPAHRRKRAKCECSKVPECDVFAGLPCPPESFTGVTNGGGRNAQRPSIRKASARQKYSYGPYRGPRRGGRSARPDGRNRGRHLRARRAQAPLGGVLGFGGRLVHGRRGHLRHHRPGPPADREGPGHALPAHRAGAAHLRPPAAR